MYVLFCRNAFCRYVILCLNLILMRSRLTIDNYCELSHLNLLFALVARLAER